ncbi:polysaccharide biosynthesis protein GumN [Caulobacter sp. Root1455]|nr:polysaccharide biosynthesis protein GumN [Caulobacter sp. Root1455]
MRDRRLSAALPAVPALRCAAAGMTALGLLFCGPAAFAQQAVDASGPIDLRVVDPEANLVEALVVNARLPGPAWWKVSDADTTVYVLGVPAMTPSKLEVDESVFKRRVDGANVLIMGQEADISVVRIVGLALGGKRFFITDKPMRQTLPPELRARLEARLAIMKEKPDAMDDVKPAFAGFLVANAGEGGDVSIHLGGVTDRIREIAKGKDLEKRPRIQSLPGYSLVDAVKSLGAAPQPLQELCLDAGLRQAENGEGGVAITAERWARGEVRAVVSADRGFSRCLASTPAIARTLRSGQTDAVKAVTAALNTPGKAVAVIELRSLLAEGGVLEQLRAKGFTVTTPGE